MPTTSPLMLTPMMSPAPSAGVVVIILKHARPIAKAFLTTLQTQSAQAVAVCVIAEMNEFAYGQRLQLHNVVSQSMDLAMTPILAVPQGTYRTFILLVSTHV